MSLTDHDTDHDPDHDDFGGLHRDLRATGCRLGRRRLLRLAGGLGVSVGALQLMACGDGDSPTAPSTTTTTGSTGTGNTGGTGGTGAASCAARVPEETAGPYPGDGSNGPNVLPLTGSVRSDIRSSFAGLSGTADGVPLTIALTIVSASTCAPLAGYAVYIWHCDRLGRYSLYNSGVTNQNYLRGVQDADASGRVVFTSIFPACYAGRWPHIHFEVYPTLAAAQSVANKVATSQIALPKVSCDEVYATTGYEQSVRNMSQVSLATDNVFSDGASLALATMTGSVSSGYTAALTVAI
jgi:protocatechuate 3,4-dioxygenase beta subunit